MKEYILYYLIFKFLFKISFKYHINIINENQLRTGDIKKDSVFSSLFNKFIKKEDNNKFNKNIDVNMQNMSINKKNNIYEPNNNNKKDIEMKNPSSSSNENNNTSTSSKSLELIKQKKMNRMSMIDVNSNLSKKLASDNFDYDPVFK